MAWTFNAPMTTLSDAPTYQQAEKLWEQEAWAGSPKTTTPFRCR